MVFLVEANMLLEKIQQVHASFKFQEIGILKSKIWNDAFQRLMPFHLHHFRLICMLMALPGQIIKL